MTAANPLGRKRGRPKQDPALATEAWMMRVRPEWHDRVMAKAKEWGVSGSELVRLMVDMSMEGDMLERPEPGESIRDRIRRGTRQK